MQMEEMKKLAKEIQRLNEELDTAKKFNDVEKMQRQNALTLIDAAKRELGMPTSNYDSKTSFMRVLAIDEFYCPAIEMTWWYQGRDPSVDAKATRKGFDSYLVSAYF
ncbi:uncharacterized protein N0V96_011579 [Colletotrichum fioriniae]|uniref:uncharacterized protein n=1 Tax=Colletotrichum fioriniae TaxID=710243 RepID=UPI0032DBB596|nr:hypothetical protein N0V96_011579 [Colletotrichum fioriniae]